jgi:hypothetical protein
MSGGGSRQVLHLPDVLHAEYMPVEVRATLGINQSRAFDFSIFVETKHGRVFSDVPKTNTRREG